jgi:hypothetical protein
VLIYRQEKSYLDLMKILLLTLFLFFASFVISTESHPLHSIQTNSLLHYAKNVHSQRGEDGILQEIFARLEIQNGFFVEFGAWDGIHLSNTRKLIEQGWSGVFIESHADRFRDLSNNYKDAHHILCIKEFVTCSEQDPRGQTIDKIADHYFPTREIDFMSIDIDGADYLIVESLRRKPKVLCVEGGFSWNPHFTQRVPDPIAFENLQQPLSVMIEIGRQKGYEPVCFTQNLILIRSDLYEPFKNIANDPVSLWRDAWCAFPPKDQQWLLNFRATNSLIRKTEGTEFFDLNLWED